MSSFVVLAIFSALVVIVHSNEGGGPMKTFHECAKENGLDMKTIKDIKKIKDVEKLPKEYLCTTKCTWEKDGSLKDEKPDMEKIKKNEMLLSMMNSSDNFIKCIQAIDSVKDCEGAKKIHKCTEDNRCRHLEECAKELKVDEDEYHEWFHKHMGKGKKDDKEEMPKNIMCLKKCIFEKKGVIGKDEKFDPKKVTTLFRKLKDREAFLKCLDGLKITKCEDMKGFNECMKAQGGM